jgi:hypothetical protein
MGPVLPGASFSVPKYTASITNSEHSAYSDTVDKMQLYMEARRFLVLDVQVRDCAIFSSGTW